MEEFNKIKAEVLSELENRNISDLKRSLIEKKIAKYESIVKSLIELNIQYPTPHNEAQIFPTINYFKEEIETINRYNDIEFSVFNTIQEFNQEIDNGFYGDDVDYLIYFVCDKPKVTNALTADNIKSLKTLLYLTAQYRADTIKKALVSKGGAFRPERTTEVKSDKEQTKNKAIKAISERFERYKHDLLVNGLVNQKTKKLWDIMLDFQKNPDTYIPDIPEINANVDTIRAFLRRLKISTDDINSYIAYFKNEDNYSKPS